jgi:hypothetical protein
VLEAGHAITFGIEEPASPYHANRAARGFRFGPLGKERVELGSDRVRRWLSRRSIDRGGTRANPEHFRIVGSSIKKSAVEGLSMMEVATRAPSPTRRKR